MCSYQTEAPRKIMLASLVNLDEYRLSHVDLTWSYKPIDFKLIVACTIKRGGAFNWES